MSKPKKKAPRKPSPTPRSFEIIPTVHLRERGNERGISISEVNEAIVTGTEEILEDQLEDGAYISKFRKSFIVRKDSHPVTKRVVAVCKIADQKCIILTCYCEQVR